MTDDAKPTPWWKPRTSQVDLPTDAQTSWRKMGKVDRAALLLFEEILGLVIEDDWLDTIEAVLEATTDVDPDDVAAYDKAYDRLESAILVRACRAVINAKEDRPDRIAHVAMLRATEKAMQT